jgi:uncharacterized protein with von Willebrand factor type A (vWA) domain
MRADSACGRPALSLSGYWRIDWSDDRSRELASVLGGAASQAELVQTRLRQSRFGARGEPISPIVLDPKLLSGFAAPVPASVVDCLVGLAVREAACRELSACSSAWEDWETLTEGERLEFSHIHRVLEDVFIAARLARVSPVLGKYLSAMRAMLSPGMPRRVLPDTGGPVTREAVLELWLAVALHGGELLPDVRGDLLAAVETLRKMAQDYVRIRNPHRRLGRAGEIWRWLDSFPPGAGDGLTELGWEREKNPESARDREAESARARMRRNVLGGGETGNFMDLSAYLVDAPRPAAPDEALGAMEEAGEGVAVVTEELRALGVRAAATMIRDARFDPDDYELVRAQVTQEIEAVRRLFARLDDAESRWRHGLRRGKLDGRSLSKVGAGKSSVFKVRDRRHGTSMALVFLVDVSASMHSYMSVVDRAACVVAEALRGLAPQVWYEVLTYTSGGLHPGAPVQLTRLASSGTALSLRDVWSDGGTPTGEAMAAALLELRRRRAARKLVLHFTDGHPKDTYVVRQALELCRRAGVDVLTVSVGAPQEALYGAGKCEVAYTVSELPGVLTRLLPRLYR